MAVNGQPTFFSAQFLSTEDTDKVFDLAHRIQAAVDAVAP